MTRLSVLLSGLLLAGCVAPPGYAPMGAGVDFKPPPQMPGMAAGGSSQLAFATEPGRRGVALRVSGRIVQGDAERLEAAARKAGASEIVISSEGGSWTEGHRIGRTIRRLGLSTRVPDGAVCASACLDAFLGGVQRSAGTGARMGAHVGSGAGNPEFVRQFEGVRAQQGPQLAIRMVEVGIARLIAQDAAYFVEMGVGLGLLRAETEASPGGMNWLTREQLREFRVVTEE